MMPSDPTMAVARLTPDLIRKIRTLAVLAPVGVWRTDRAVSNPETGKDAQEVLADLVCLAGLAHDLAGTLRQSRDALRALDSVSIVALASVEDALAATDAALAPFETVRLAREAEAAAAAKAEAEGRP